MNYDGKVNTKGQLLQYNLEGSRENGMKNKLSFKIYGIKTCCLSHVSERAIKRGKNMDTQEKSSVLPGYIQILCCGKLEWENGGARHIIYTLFMFVSSRTDIGFVFCSMKNPHNIQFFHHFFF